MDSGLTAHQWALARAPGLFLATDGACGLRSVSLERTYILTRGVGGHAVIEPMPLPVPVPTASAARTVLVAAAASASAAAPLLGTVPTPLATSVQRALAAVELDFLDLAASACKEHAANLTAALDSLPPVAAQLIAGARDALSAYSPPSHKIPSARLHGVHHVIRAAV
jgi:hypothetical protein